jgi:hypothetical protein
MSSRQKRKRRQRTAVQPQPQEPRPPSRSELKNAEARAALVPLEPGERPTPVTIGAIVAAALGLVNIGLYIAGFEIDGERPQIVGVLAFSALMLTAAWGMWKVRYWAVLGMQALLGLLIVVFSLFAVTASDVWSLLFALAVIGSTGTLFWYMVKAMARIQMPTRDQ